MRLSEIREQIGSGEYRVNTQAVAEAILRRLLVEPRPFEVQGVSQEECS